MPTERESARGQAPVALIKKEEFFLSKKAFPLSKKDLPRKFRVCLSKRGVCYDVAYCATK